jgi:hypothetical protein
MKAICVFGLLLMAAFAGILRAQETWPTPYSADEIRDAWVEGFAIVTRTRTPDGVSTSRTEVIEWTTEGAVIIDQQLDTTGAPKGEGTSISVSWEELRAHAVFSKETTSRLRQTRATPLGELNGWAYSTVDGEDFTEFFFADGLPGPPAVYSQAVGGEIVFLAEQLERSVK